MGRNRLALFCEDAGHAAWTRALIQRLARARHVSVGIHDVSAQGGKGTAISQLKVYQRIVARGSGSSDLLVVVIDGNCVGWQEKQREVRRIVDPEVFPRAVIGCPHPHVERWCFADPEAFTQVVGPAPDVPEKCERGLYKNLLAGAVREAGLLLLTGDPMELAPDIVAVMDLLRAGRSQPSLGQFVADLTREIGSLSPSS